MWDEGVFGNPVDPAGTVFENRAHMTTAKAMLINTASQYDWTRGGPNADLSRFRQGWGMPDLERMYEMRDRLIVVDETDLLANTGSTVYETFVIEDEPMFKATLVYADPAGVPFSEQHRINALSLRVIDPSGRGYWGNNGLADGLWSTAGGSPNAIDTVENVFVENPDPGPWMIEVIAHELIEDGHVETQELDADYALVISGISLGCPEDVDENGVIEFDDLLAVLAAWGPCEDCPEDIDGSGEVDFDDLLRVLGAWGPC